MNPPPGPYLITLTVAGEQQKRSSSLRNFEPTFCVCPTELVVPPTSSAPCYISQKVLLPLSVCRQHSICRTSALKNSPMYHDDRGATTPLFYLHSWLSTNFHTSHSTDRYLNHHITIYTTTLKVFFLLLLIQHTRLVYTRISLTSFSSQTRGIEECSPISEKTQYAKVYVYFKINH